MIALLVRDAIPIRAMSMIFSTCNTSQHPVSVSGFDSADSKLLTREGRLSEVQPSWGVPFHVHLKRGMARAWTYLTADQTASLNADPGKEVACVGASQNKQFSVKEWANCSA